MIVFFLVFYWFLWMKIDLIVLFLLFRIVNDLYLFFNFLKIDVVYFFYKKFGDSWFKFSFLELLYLYCSSILCSNIWMRIGLNVFFFIVILKLFCIFSICKVVWGLFFNVCIASSVGFFFNYCRELIKVLILIYWL